MSIAPNAQFPYYPVGYTGGYSWDDVSPWITQYESGNRNILSGVAGSTASGYWQINNPTWQQYAPAAGVDLSQYPTAMSAPQSVQAAVAEAIFNARGIEPWSTAPQVLAALDGGSTPSGGGGSMGGNTAIGAYEGGPSATQQQTGWLYSVFDTLSSFIGRTSIMLMGGALIGAGLLMMALQGKMSNATSAITKVVA